MMARQTAAAIAGASLRPRGEREIALDVVYRSLPSIDFSRTVLGGSAADLRLLLVPECGWTDLGTPRRVDDCVTRIELANPDLPIPSQWCPTVDLAQALARRGELAHQ